jgi:hypothetical protein
LKNNKMMIGLKSFHKQKTNKDDEKLKKRREKEGSQKKKEKNWSEWQMLIAAANFLFFIQLDSSDPSFNKCDVQSLRRKREREKGEG